MPGYRTKVIKYVADIFGSQSKAFGFTLRDRFILQDQGDGHIQHEPPTINQFEQPEGRTKPRA
jgi:hypothetical protein